MKRHHTLAASTERAVTSYIGGETRLHTVQAHLLTNYSLAIIIRIGLDSGLAGTGNIMVFNNGWQRPAGNYSTVEIFAPPVDSSGNYALVTNQPFQPDSSSWIYKGTPPASFYSQTISGAQRLSNGNTLICEGDSGIFFEIDSAQNIVWRYVSPVTLTGIVSQGTIPVNNSVFRCTLYEPSYAGFAGQTLTSGNPIELNPLPYTCSTLYTGIKQPAVITNAFIHVINPFADELLIETDNDLTDANVILLDLAGRKVAELAGVNLSSSSYRALNLGTSLSPGVYFLSIESCIRNWNIQLIHQ